MQTFIETNRFLLREIIEEDAQDLFELDNNPAVHKYLGNNPLTKLEEVQKMIQHIRQQYQENGIGRWAIIDKKTKDFIGWSGLKYEYTQLNNLGNYYDLGYRLKQQYWGKGIATETAKASLAYGFEQLKLTEIYAAAHVDNIASNTILKKLGMDCLETFDYDGNLCNWYWINNSSYTIV